MDLGVFKRWLKSTGKDLPCCYLQHLHPRPSGFGMTLFLNALKDNVTIAHRNSRMHSTVDGASRNFGFLIPPSFCSEGAIDGKRRQDKKIRDKKTLKELEELVSVGATAFHIAEERILCWHMVQKWL